MDAEPRVFLDTSVLFASVWSESGGSRLILKLGEAGAVALWIGPTVLKEAEAVLRRKAPESRSHMALLLDRAQVQVGPEAGEENLAQALSAVGYPPDAQVLAEALEIEADYLVSLDHQHLVGNPRMESLPVTVGTPGDFLAWYRQKLMQGELVQPGSPGRQA